MKLEDVIARPTVAQIRGRLGSTEKTPVTVKCELELQKIVHHIYTRINERAKDDTIQLFDTNTYLRFLLPLFPIECLPADRSLNTAQRKFTKTNKQPFYDIAKNASNAEELRKQFEEAGSTNQLLYNTIATKAGPLRPGYAFTPTVTAGKKTRFVYWNQLCAGKLMQDKLGSDAISIKTYIEAKNATLLGGQVLAEITYGEGEKFEVAFENVPFNEEDNQTRRSFALDYDAVNAKARISAIQFGSRDDFGGHERKEFVAPVIAAWYEVCNQMEKAGHTTKEKSPIIMPSPQLLDAYKILRDHSLYFGRQSTADKNPREFVLRQAQMDYVLGTLIQQHPELVLPTGQKTL